MLTSFMNINKFQFNLFPQIITASILVYCFLDVFIEFFSYNIPYYNFDKVYNFRFQSTQQINCYITTKLIQC